MPMSLPGISLSLYFPLAESVKPSQPSKAGSSDASLAAPQHTTDPESALVGLMRKNVNEKGR